MDRYVRAIVIIIACMSSMVLSAQTAHKLFEKGLKEYKRGAIESALCEFEAMPEKGAGAWFNIGACHEALQNFPQACICYQRAQLKASNALRAKCEAAQKELFSKLSVPSEQQSWVERIAMYVSPLFLQLLFLVCWYCMWIMGLFYREQRWLYGVQTLLFLLLVLVGSFLFVHYKDNQYVTGMTIKDVSMLAGPDARYDVLLQIPRLQKVHLKDARPGWYKVSTQKGIGWIPAEMIELV